MKHVFVLFLIASASAQAFLYDDFSSSPLDTNLWNETTDSIAPDVHMVDNGVYLVQQFTPLQRSIRITALRPFNAGETLSFQVAFTNVTNATSRLVINGKPVNLTPIGNLSGLYLINSFFDVFTELTITLPNGSNTTMNMSNVTFPAAVGIETVTNGDIALMGYDVFLIYDQAPIVPEFPAAAMLFILATGLCLVALRRR